MADSEGSAATEDGDGGETRRDFLQLATGAFALVGGAAVAWPFIQQMNPNSMYIAGHSENFTSSSEELKLLGQTVYRCKGG